MESKLNEAIVFCIKQNISQFIKAISTKYGINELELTELWTGSSITQTPITNDKEVVEKQPQCDIPTQPTSTSVVAAAASELDKLSKKELIDLCKTKGIKVTGTKQELVSRILDSEKTAKISKNIISEQPTRLLKQKQEASTSNGSTNNASLPKPAASKPPSILEAIKASSGSHIITKNKFGNYMHEQTGLVFKSAIDHKIIGRQGDDGSIIQLTSDDINICNQYKFDYILPENLDMSVNLKDVKVAELDEGAAPKSDDSEGEESGDDVEVEELIEDDEDDIEYEEYEEEVEYE